VVFVVVVVDDFVVAVVGGFVVVVVEGFFVVVVVLEGFAVVVVVLGALRLLLEHLTGYTAWQKATPTEYCCKIGLNSPYIPDWHTPSRGARTLSKGCATATSKASNRRSEDLEKSILWIDVRRFLVVRSVELIQYKGQKIQKERVEAES